MKNNTINTQKAGPMQKFIRPINPKYVSIAKKLNRYLVQRYDLNKPPVHAKTNGRMYAFTVPVNLKLRFGPSSTYKWGNNNTLIIFSFEFEQKRKGNGTSLLNFLRQIALAHNYDFIGIEQAETVGSENFAKKHGFTRLKGDDWMKKV